MITIVILFSMVIFCVVMAVKTSKKKSQNKHKDIKPPTTPVEIKKKLSNGIEYTISIEMTQGFVDRKSHGPSSEKKQEKMVQTEAIKDLLNTPSTVSKKENILFREDYETPMYSRDFSLFIIERIKNNDIESIWQFLCLFNDYAYNGECYITNTLAEDLLVDMVYGKIKSRLRGIKKYEIPYIMSNKKPAIRYKIISEVISSEFDEYEKSIFNQSLYPKKKTDRDRLDNIISIKLDDYIKTHSNCLIEIISMYVLYNNIHKDPIERGRHWLCNEIADVASIALCIYDFQIKNVTPLIERANHLIKWEKKEIDFFKEMSCFDMNLFLGKFEVALETDLKYKLASLGVNERYYFLHDCLYNATKLQMTPYYKTKYRGIDENKINESLINNKLVITDTDIDRLLSKSKLELIEIAKVCNLVIRKSWTKEMIFNEIKSYDDSSDILYSILIESKYYKLNPIYEQDIYKLLEYSKSLNGLMQLIGFA